MPSLIGETGMRRNLEEINAEIQKRCAEYEQKKRARLKGLGVGAGAALALALLALPFAGGIRKNGGGLSGGTAERQNAMNAPQAIDSPGEETNGLEPTAQTVDAMPPPNATEPPGSTGSGGAPCYGGNGEKADTSALQWRRSGENEYFSAGRNELVPERAEIVLVDELGKHGFDVRSASDAGRIMEGLLALLDNSAMPVSDIIGSTVLNLELIKADAALSVSLCDDGSVFVGLRRYITDTKSAEVFAELVRGICKGYPEINE